MVVAKISLDRTSPLRPPLRLDDDPAIAELPAQLPRITLLERSAIGRTEDGQRVFDWSELGEMLVVSYHEQVIPVSDEVVRHRVKLTFLWDEEDVLDSNDLAFRIDAEQGNLGVYRIQEFDQNGFRIKMTGERAL